MEHAMETAVTEMAAEATDSGTAEAPELPEVVLTPADIYARNTIERPCNPFDTS